MDLNGLWRHGPALGKPWQALKAHGKISCPGGPCSAAVLKPSKWTVATWPGAGKAVAKR